MIRRPHIVALTQSVVYCSNSVITSGVIGLELMTDRGAGIQERSRACQASIEEYTHTDTLMQDETVPGVSSHAGVNNENRQRVCLLYYT